MNTKWGKRKGRRYGACDYSIWVMDALYLTTPDLRMCWLLNWYRDGKILIAEIYIKLASATVVPIDHHEVARRNWTTFETRQTQFPCRGPPNILPRHRQVSPNQFATSPRIGTWRNRDRMWLYKMLGPIYDDRSLGLRHHSAPEMPLRAREQRKGVLCKLPGRLPVTLEMNPCSV